MCLVKCLKRLYVTISHLKMTHFLLFTFSLLLIFFPHNLTFGDSSGFSFLIQCFIKVAFISGRNLISGNCGVVGELQVNCR